VRRNPYPQVKVRPGRPMRTPRSGVAAGRYPRPLGVHASHRQARRSTSRFHRTRRDATTRVFGSRPGRQATRLAVEVPAPNGQLGKPGYFRQGPLESQQLYRLRVGCMCGRRREPGGGQHGNKAL